MTEKIPFTPKETDRIALVPHNRRDVDGNVIEGAPKMIKSRMVAEDENGQLWAYETDEKGVKSYRPVRAEALDPTIQERLANDALERGDMTPEELEEHQRRVQEMAEKTLEVSGVDEPMPEAKEAPATYEDMVETAKDIALTEAEEIQHEQEVLDHFEHPEVNQTNVAVEASIDESPMSVEETLVDEPEQIENEQMQAQIESLKTELQQLMEHGGSEVLESSLRFQKGIHDAEVDFQHVDREIAETIAQLRLVVGGQVSSPMRLIDDARMMLNNAYRAMQRMGGSLEEARVAKTLAIDRYGAYDAGVRSFIRHADEVELSLEPGSDEKRQVKRIVDDANELVGRANHLAGSLEESERPFSVLSIMREDTSTEIEGLMRQLDNLHPSYSTKEDAAELMKSIKRFHEDGQFSTLREALRPVKKAAEDVVVSSRKLANI